MTFLEVLKKEKAWHRRALIISYFHQKMCLKRKRWTMRATAKQLRISLGNVSESINLANGLLKYPEIENMGRNEALRVVRYKYYPKP